MDRLVAERKYKVHNYEADGNGRIMISSLMNYLEDIAIEQANEFGSGIEYLKQNNIAWVVYRWNVKINKYAKVGETLKVRTWPHTYRKFYAYRKHEIVNSDGEVIVAADSIWFMIDISKRRPCKISAEIVKMFGLKEGDKEEIIFEKLSAPLNNDVQKNFQVRYSDIDMNNHVNNVKYISWALETVPINIIKKLPLKELSISYEKETKYGEIVTVNSEVTENEERFVVSSSLVNESGDKLTLVKTEWDKSEGSN